MLSKNNRKEQFRKQEPKKQRFAIKKLTVGVASVLIGFTFMGMSASADANNTPASSTQPASESSTDDDNNASPSTVPLKTPVAPTQGLNATPVSNQMAANTSAQDQIKENQAITPAQKEDSTVKTAENTNPSSAADKYADKVAKNYQNKLQVLASLGQTPADNTATTQETQPKVLRGTQSQDVSDWQGFVNAMNNGNVGTINITGDIVVNNTANGTRPSGITESNKNYLYLDSQGSAGTVDINGNNHKITFGNYSLALQAKNEKNIDKTWNLTFKDLTIDAASSSYAPISFYKTSSKDVLTYENVTANLANRPLVDNYSNGMTVNLNNVTTTITNAANNVVTGNTVNVNGSTFTVDGGSNVINGTATVNFTGDNAITLTNMVMGGSNINTASANAVYSNKVNFNSGTTTFNVDGNIANKSSSAINQNNWMVRASSQDADTVVINQGATVNLNSKSANMRGIWAGRQSAAGQPSYGSLVVNGNLNANMANGHSTAIFAQNLEIGTGADVTIHTKQDNQADGTENDPVNQNTNSNSTHQAPITIFLGPNSSVSGPVSAQEGHIINNGNLTVIRDNTNKTLVPLISFGQGLGTNMTLKFVNGEGSTLDLQDNSGTYLYGTEPSAPFSGLITMWGTSANDIIQFDDPKYINLQRTGETRGTLIRLEAVDNKTTIKGSTPVAQWDQGNKTATPNYAWYVDLVQTQSQWGNNSGTFLGKNQTPNHVVAHNGVQTLYNSNATVKMAANQGDQEYNKDHVNTTEAAMQLNSFLNNFNYWRPQRIAMGSKLTPSINDADKYQPEVQTINGTTTQTLNDLNAKDGIKDLIGPNNETIANFDNIISKVSWYNSATDQAEWNKLMIQPTESKNSADQTPYAQPQNPTGDLKTADKSAWAKVTYKDGTVDFVNIPLNITEPMAGIYTPSYKPVTVEQGQSATDNPTFTDQSGKDTTAPTGTTFTTGTDTPAWATVDPSTGTVTVKPGTDVTPGAYNVPVTVTYPDKSTDETTVPVIVTKAGQTVTWGDNGAVVTTVDTSKLNAHETTENSQVLSPSTVVTAEGYELTDGKLSTTATPIIIDPSTVSWTITPDTNVTTATAAGKQIENNTIKIDLTNNDAANNILGSKNGVVTTNPFTIDAKGAGAKNVTTTPVNVALGSDLTGEQFNQLVDNNIPTDEIATTTWATKPNEQGQGGVIKITFTDKDANGTPTYLNVNVPSSSIKITTDADDHNPEGQNVSTKVGETPDAEKGIKNPGSLPNGTTYTWQTTPNTTTPGKEPAVVVVTYPDGSKDEVPVTIHVTNPATDADKYTPESQDVNTKTGVVPDPADGIKNKADLPDGTKYTWTNPDQVAQDVKKPGSYTETITVRYPDGSEDTVTVTVNVPAPEGQNITTDQGQLPNPADAIKNKDQMPNGTTYTWKQEPDVSTPGDHTGVVEVHFPDGTTYEVTINVHVDAINPDNGGNTNSGNGSIDHQNGTEINNGSVIENVTGQTQNSATNSTSQQPAKTLPQTGNDSSKFSALAGLSLAAFVSLFGFAGHDKKRKADK
ncbi:YSIRK-type signal peptide-containing protein [Limosilactobacillus sp. c11Ua_112_M]|uniref:Rib/alpha-like domain-containing protein n=1 Tax=Limosilactobacillus portuensis TaxID=2742601 RepID=UPI00177EF8BD|nr:Rib/alpha-like domain-containing protein [Limosilactobacillus portuensis]MBD8087576.1 YSIRK-type signal peptide-containing protein [Limosilactobacillus portuensis]